MGGDELEIVESGMSQLKMKQDIPDSVDSRKLYKNFSDTFWFTKDEQQSKWISMVELTTKITNITSAILLLFQFVYSNFYGEKDPKRKIDEFMDGTKLLTERPGLQNITYVAKYDLFNGNKLTS